MGLTLLPSGAEGNPAPTPCLRGRIGGCGGPSRTWRPGYATRRSAGGPRAATRCVTVADLLAKPEAFDGKEALVEGTVRRACSRKGCWMELSKAGDAKGPGVRVTFKNYGFFVPTDSAGSAARVQGTVKVATLSADLAAHYESEGATVPRGADGQPRELQLVASGVELRGMRRLTS